MKPLLLLLLISIQTLVFAGARIEPIPGTGVAGYTDDGGPAAKRQLNSSYGLSVGPGGALFVCDIANDRIRRIHINRIIDTVAGSGAKGRQDAKTGTTQPLLEPENPVSPEINHRVRRRMRLQIP